MITFYSRYYLSAPVIVDDQLEGRVIAIRFYSAEPEYLVGWFDRGESKSDWFASWRIEPKAEQ